MPPIAVGDVPKIDEGNLGIDGSAPRGETAAVASDFCAAQPHPFSEEWAALRVGIHGGDNRAAGRWRGSTSKMARRAQRVGPEQGKAPPSGVLSVNREPAPAPGLMSVRVGWKLNARLSSGP